MKPVTRLLLAFLAFAAIAAFSVARRDETPLMLAASYTGVATIDGALQLYLSITPPAGTPRDSLQLNARLTNHNLTYASPQVRIDLPSTLQAEATHLPAGVTIHVSSNSIQWLPLLPAAGGVRELSLPLRVSSADLKHPEQRVDVELSNDTAVLSSAAHIWIGIPPRVEGFDSPSQVSVGQPLQLKALVQSPGPLAEAWELGDGRRVAVNSPTVVYPVAGVYDVSMTVKNPVGEATHKEQITVVPHVSASFRPEDETVMPGQAIVFSNTGGGQQPVDYRWDFGDGSSSTEAQPSHAFDQPGTYQVKLVAENAFGVSEAKQTITVGLPPKANIVVADSTSAGKHLAGEVIAPENAQPATAYSWEMGDGRRYSSAKISHAYRRSGDYYVTVTASNAFGETQVGRWIHVEEGEQQVYMPMVSYFGGLAQGSSAEALPQLLDAIPELPDLEAPFVMEPLLFAVTPSPTEQLLAYINEARRYFELPKLTRSEPLSIAAQKHSEDMAAARHNEHTGSDGSAPAERFLQHGYANGYAGEATAWGFIDPRQAVEFWVNSPGHRPIILNPYASEVGLGYTVDYTAPSVWYWTAEFGNAAGSAETPVLRVSAPADSLETLNSRPIMFIWNWPLPLSSAEQFTVHLTNSSGPVAVRSVREPATGTQYRLSIEPTHLEGFQGAYQWQVRLENNRGSTLASSEQRSLLIALDPNLPTATPIPTVSPVASPSVQPTGTPTPTVTVQPPTSRPTEPPLPPLVTATPLPVDPQLP